MTKSDRIGHLTIMARANVEHTRSSLLDEQYGYIWQLEQIAKDGGFITPETEEAISLQNAATDLIRAAQRLLLIRDKLIENDHPMLSLVK